MSVNFSEFIDPLILPAVEVLNTHGFKTYESCQGGEGHCFPEPTVRFEGEEFDLIRAFSVCELYRLNVFAAKKVYMKGSIYSNDNTPEVKEKGSAWSKPFYELTFCIHSKTGTIFLPD